MRSLECRLLQPSVNTVPRSVTAGEAAVRLWSGVQCRPYTKLNTVASGRFSLSTEVGGVSEVACE